MPPPVHGAFQRENFSTEGFWRDWYGGRDDLGSSTSRNAQGEFLQSERFLPSLHVARVVDDVVYCTIYLCGLESRRRWTLRLMMMSCTID